MNQSAQESAGGQNNCGAGKPPPIRQYNAVDSIVFESEIENLPLDHFEVWLVGNSLLHCLAIELAVGLCSRAADSRSLPPIEQAKLDAGAVSHTTHEPVQRIDFPNQMALAQTADCGIT